MDFIAFIHEVFERFGSVTIKRMFGGHGIFYDGLMFALVYRETLYLKADPENLHYFTELGLGRMRSADGSEFKISYYAAPVDLLEDRELARLWAQRSYGAALRARAKKRSRPAKR